MFGSYLLETFSFLMKDRKGMDPEGMRGRENLERVEGVETVKVK